MSGKTEKIELSNEEIEAEVQQCLARTHGLFLRQNDEQGSAVAVKIGSRFFLATAGHITQDDAEIEVVRRQGQVKISDFVRRFGIKDNPDVGLLELTQDQTADLGPFLEGDQIFCPPDLQGLNQVVVFGFPAKGRIREGPLHGASFPSFNIVETIPKKQWPSNVDPPPNPEWDFFIRYPRKGLQQIVTTQSPYSPQNAKILPIAPPYGLSGGGVWLFTYIRKKPSGLLIPSAQLVGLQVSWYEETRVLKGVSIKAWLEFVQNHYPDLEDDIQRIAQRTKL